MHDMTRKNAQGHGSWMQCEKCGCTKHHGFFWLGGRKSRTEPDCLNGTDLWSSDWWLNAADCDLEK